MPLVIKCPKCCEEFRVPQSPTAYGTACPECGAIFTIPAILGTSSPDPKPDPFGTLDETPDVDRAIKRRREKRERKATRRLVVVGILLALVVIPSVVFAVKRAKKGNEPEVAARKDEAPPLPAPKPESKPTPKKELPKAEPNHTPKSEAKKELSKEETPKVSPQPPKPRTFEEAWDEAIELGKKLDELEPAESERVTKSLSMDDFVRMRFNMPGPIAAGQVPALYQPMINELRRLGFHAYVERASRARAAVDPKFKQMAEIVWKAKTNPGGILAMMNAWNHDRSDWRARASEAIIMGTPADQIQLAAIRDVVLLLAGPTWFERK